MKNKKIKMKGCGMPANVLQHFLELIYAGTHRTDAPKGYSYDSALSDARVKVYPKNNSNEVVVVHRGSEGLTDWMDNASYLAYGKVNGTTSYNLHRKKHKAAADKYGAENIIGVGHSRAGLYIQELDKEFPMKELITYNKAAGPSDILKINPSKQTDVRVGNDVVSLLAPTQLGNKTVTIPGTKNPFNLTGAHKPQELSKLGDQYIGLGLSGGGAKPKERTLPELKKLLEKYKKQLDRAENGFLYKTYTKNQFRSITQATDPHKKQLDVILWYISMIESRIEEYEKSGKDKPMAINFTNEDYGKYYPSKADLKKINEYKNLTNTATIERILKSLRKKEAKINAGKEYKNKYEADRVGLFLGALYRGGGLKDNLNDKLSSMSTWIDKKLFRDPPIPRKKDESWEIIHAPNMTTDKERFIDDIKSNTRMLDSGMSDWVSVPSYENEKMSKKMSKKTGKGLVLKF